MRTATLRVWLLDALVAGTAATAGCTSSSRASLPPSQPAALPPPTPPTAPAPQVAIAEPSQVSSTSLAAPVRRYQVPAGKTGACVDGLRNVLPDLKPSGSVDYLELRQRSEGGAAETLLAHGAPCANAALVDACHKALREPATAGFGSACRPGQCDFHLVVTDPAGVRRLVSPAEVAAFLGAADTPGEALLLAFANNHAVLGCDKPIPVKVGKAWQVTTNLMVEECPIVTADVTLSIAENGAVTVIRTTNRKTSNTCVGRRPPGLRIAKTRAGTAIGSYLEACAHLEAASVPAFERLSRELAAFGAPARLMRLCGRAAADERRHARVMNRLARAYGARAPEVVLEDAPARDAVALAVDNAAEGCVRETFGAVVGLHQAQCAGDPRVRAAMSAIARDEIRHAALAWKIAGWIEPKLGPHGAERVKRARARAVEELREELCVEPAADLRTTLGLPSAAVAVRMADALSRTLWS